jgi:primosomal protein N' (replication factor Y)
MIASVLLPLKLDKTFYYKIPQGREAFIGQLVEVNFHYRIYQGVIVELHPADKSELELKTINQLFNLPPLSAELLSFIKWVADYTITPQGLIFKMLCSVKINPQKLVQHQTQAEEEIKQTQFHPQSVELSAEQEKVAAQLLTKLHSGFDVTVLDGVTGSGKTEVYLKVINEVISSGGQVLVLLPEIVLTNQLIDRFAQRFGFRPLEWHSNLSTKQRRINWLNIISGRAKFVVGARSALFLPFANLKLIVVDEEHDSSFKQEEGVIYNARDMAVVRAKLQNFPLLLCSATPSLETVYNVLINKYNILHLASRYGQAVMPEIEVVDLSRNMPAKGQSLALPTQHALLANYAMGKQSMLFLNRRGYAPLTLCGNCHNKIGCPNCNSWLVEHRQHKKLICHLCGYNMPLISECPSCGDMQKITSIGIGVEKLAEEVHKIMPMARLGILSSDTMLNQKKVSEMLTAISNQEIDVIIGTQMIAKGLHFPELKLVVIVDADAGYSVGDVRVLERTFQLFYQVAGRAGRTKEKGKVLVQTYDPQANIILSMQQNDKKGFVESELKDRELAKMPPFSNLALLTFTSFDEKNCLLYAKKFAAIAVEATGIKVLGPAPAPMFYVRQRYRYRILINSSRQIKIQPYIKNWLQKIDLPAAIKLSVDIDPYNFY